MKEYVVGFMFDDTGENVVLINKNRPDWQKGRCNGVGGKVESNEMSMAAMIREFREETGVETTSSDWTHFAFMWGDNPEFEIAFYRAFNSQFFENAKTSTDEEIEKWCVENISFPFGDFLISNLQWLIPLALEKNKVFADLHYQ